jgi:hypothetical protein
VPAISQITINAENGVQPIPPKFTIKKILEIIQKPMYENKEEKRCTLDLIVKEIRKTVFGDDNYRKYKDIIKINNFEYDKSLGLNYVSLLNKNYFYNVPETCCVPTRNFILFGDDFENYALPGGDPNGGSEAINGANRIFTDMWNSNELDFSYALTQYSLNVNNFKPAVLPTCLFKIYPTNNEYINYNMIENDTLIVNLFDRPIQYGEVVAPIASCTVIFPATSKPLNINQFIELVNNIFSSTYVTINGVQTLLSNILSLDWTFFPYKISYITNKTVYIKTVMMKTTNKSQHYISLIGKWQLLQFFGKTVASGMMNMPSMNNNSQNNQNSGLAFVCPLGKGDKCTCIPKSDIKNGDSMKSLMGIDKFPDNYNMNIQEVFAVFATNDPNNPITTYDDNAVMIINSNSTYYGFIDGFQSDSLMNFSVKKDSSEKWIYNNLDIQDTHPFHFHMTSGFVDPYDNTNSCGLVSKKNSHFPYIYSKETYGIGPQQSIGFYLKFPNYSSDQSFLNPPIRYLGYMYHCHYLCHHDSSMMGQYFVYKKREEFF